jgi:two-component system sensor histidine kinase HydH
VSQTEGRRGNVRRTGPLRMVRKRRLYVPAVTIVTVALTITVMHAVSTVRTLDRERRHWENFLEQSGRDVLAMLRVELQMQGPVSRQRLRAFLDTAAKNLDVIYIGVMDDRGQWTVSTQPSVQPYLPPKMTPETLISPEGRKTWRVERLPDGKHVFQYWEKLEVGDLRTAVVGLWMTPLEEARGDDIRHAVLMGIILLVLGSAAFYFIFVVQNYYLVDRTLTQMRSYTEDVVESMASGLITVDTDGRIVSTNRKASAILGPDTREARGQPLGSVIPPHCLNVEESLREEKVIIEKEIDCPLKEGFIPLSVSVTPLKASEGVSLGAVIILRDLREIRDLQEKVRRSERLASLGRLAAGIAHEIRNPLSSIKGFTQYFRDKFDAGSEDRAYADIVIREVERLDRVIAQLLDFARPRELSLTIQPLSELLNHPLKLIETDLGKRGITLVRTTFAENEVTADTDQMTQAFLNIFLNAMDAMAEGGELDVRTVLKAKQGVVEISISDTGAGISRENLSRIFDPFFSTKKKGTGLGLAIAAKIVEAHRGELSVQSEEGKGATFTVRLPLT